MSLEHTCGRFDKLKYASSKWLCNRYSKKLKRDADLDVKSLQEDVLEDYAMLVTRHQIYRAKKRAKVMIEGSYIEQYARLRDYAEEMKKANKGSTVVIKTEQVGGQAIFLRMYVCFAGCRQGFLDGCRPVIGVDGCHVKGPYPGQILTVVGVDSNNGSFPIAYTIVEIESKQSWIWFLRLLIEDLKITNGLSYAFISDKQKGLIPTNETLLPTAEHRICVRHLYNNFRSSHSGLALKHLLWPAARATTMPQWEAEMENMKQEDEEAWKWLSQRPAKNWSRSHFNTWFKCDLLLNNLCESFNSAIVDARDQSILNCLERIRVLVMLRMANRRAACSKWKHPVGPRIFKII
ncbi:unnamed protein product [Prunus armeniaca]